MTGLELRKLAIGYGAPIKSDINFTADQGEIVAITGPSGCGKSTLLQTVLGALAPLAGRVLLGERDVTALPVHLRGIGVMYQEPLLFPHLSIAENIGYGLRKWDAAARHQRVAALLELIDLGAVGANVKELSGGQQQRVALARALAPEPPVLLLDEPLSSLDEELRNELLPQLRTMLKQSSTTALVVTHNRAEAAELADRVLDFRALGGEPSSS